MWLKVRDARLFRYAMLAKTISDYLQSIAPKAQCDECIAGAVEASPFRVRDITATLGITNDFTRVPAHCPDCGEQRPTIKAGGTQ